MEIDSDTRRRNATARVKLAAALLAAALGCGDDDANVVMDRDEETVRDASEPDAELDDDAGPIEPDVDADVPDEGVTYFGHVKPLFDAKCGLCHVTGGVAPMPLETYEDVRDWAPQIRAAVGNGRMPPWYAADGCNEYYGDRSLSDDQKALVLQWVDDGALEGDEARAAEPLPQDENDFRSDLVLEMEEAYTPAFQADEYRCFLIKWPMDTATYITGVGLRPGNEGIVHHSIIFLATEEQAAPLIERDAMDEGPGYGCFTGSNGSVSLIGAIEKAEAGRKLPYGAGMRVEPGSWIVLQQHYNTLSSDAPESDRSSLEVMVEDTVQHPATAQWFVNPSWLASPTSMLIPANEPDVVHNFQAGTFAATAAQTIYWADLHMHQLGTRGELSLIRADGTRECLLRIDDWRFEWQETYLLKTPIVMQPGDQLYLECHYDNTAGHQIVVDGERREPGDVVWGDRSEDEMCIGNFLISPAP